MASIELCIAVFEEAETDDESERQGVPACRYWKRRNGKHAKSGDELHTCRFAAAAALVTSRLLRAAEPGQVFDTASSPQGVAAWERRLRDRGHR